MKRNNLRLALGLSCIALLACQNSKEQALRNKIDHRVDYLMEAMDLPEFGFKKLGKKQLFEEKDYLEAVRELDINMTELATKTKHYDPKFQKLSLASQKDCKQLLLAIEKNAKSEKIASLHQKVLQSCKDCHKIYD